MSFAKVYLADVVYDPEFFSKLAPEIQDQIVTRDSDTDYEEQAKQIETKLLKEDLELRELVKRFKTVKELFEGGPAKIEWFVKDLLPKKCLVSFQGRAKAGKSTFTFHMLKALIEGREFLGEKLEPTKIIYLSEQTEEAFKLQLQEAGIDSESENLAYLTVENHAGLPWQTLFKLGALKAQEFGAELLVIDSWGRFVGFGVNEDEYAPAPTQRRITLLRQLMSETKVGILIIQHVGKDNSRGLIDSGLGTSALAQQVDLALSLSGEPAHREVPATHLENENCRAIQGIGRVPIRDAFAVELRDGKFILSSFSEASKTNPEDADAFLQEFLNDGPKHSEDVFNFGADQKLTKNSLYEAKKRLGIKANKNGKIWEWCLPVFSTWRAPRS